jgi:hypothetical protein
LPSANPLIFLLEEIKMNIPTKTVSVTFGALFTLPFILMVYALQPILGKKKTINIAGKMLSHYASIVLSLFIPKIKSPINYSEFQQKIKINYSVLGLLYDLTIQQETKDLIEFRVNFCPVSTVLKYFRMADLCKYSCAGDWLTAKNNRNYWIFKRDQTIGTGGKYCNHTYCGLVTNKSIKG